DLGTSPYPAFNAGLNSNGLLIFIRLVFFTTGFVVSFAAVVPASIRTAQFKTKTLKGLSNQGRYCDYLRGIISLSNYNYLHSNILVRLLFCIFIYRSDWLFFFPYKYQLTKLIRFYVLIWWCIFVQYI